MVDDCTGADGHGLSQQSGALSLVQISRDTVLSLVEPYYAGAKVYAITTEAFCASWCVRCVVMA